MVTGSTDGIGKSYALELARLGINIVLISRSDDKLKAVAEEIGINAFLSFISYVIMIVVLITKWCCKSKWRK